MIMGLLFAGLVIFILIVILAKRKKSKKKRFCSGEDYCQNVAEKIAMGLFAQLIGNNIPQVWRKKGWITQYAAWIICPLAPLYLLSFVLAWDRYDSPIPVEVMKEIVLRLPQAIVNEYKERMNLQEPSAATMRRFDQQHLKMLELWSNRPPAPNAAKPLFCQIYLWMGEKGQPSPAFLDEL